MDDPVVNVQWDVSENPHEHPFATKSEATDDGSRLGIRVFKEINGKQHEIWLTRDTPSTIPLANALVDFIEGKIVGKPYEWMPSRKYIFRILEN